jgi:ABC-type transport system involved in multi-copper enzyme maturation permease subunit
MKGKSSQILRILFLDQLRERIFLALASGAIFLLLASLVLNEMVVGERAKVTWDLGLTLLNVFSLCIILFAGIHLLGSDLSRKSLYFIFARPVTRTEYLLGAVATVLVLAVIASLLLLASLALLLFIYGKLWLPGLLAAGFFNLLEVLVVLSFAALFAMLVSPQLAMFLTLITYIIGHTIQQAAQIMAVAANTPLKIVVTALAPILPNLAFFDLKNQIAYQHLPAPTYYFYSFLYAAAYSLLIFMAAAAFFRRKEL